MGKRLSYYLPPKRRIVARAAIATVLLASALTVGGRLIAPLTVSALLSRAAAAQTQTQTQTQGQPTQGQPTQGQAQRGQVAATDQAIRPVMQPATGPASPPAGPIAAVLTEPCAVPPDFANAPASLPATAAALQAHTPIVIVALGSGTMQGPRGATEGSFPSLMAEMLRVAHPGTTITLITHSGRGMTAADMLTALRGDLAAHVVTLVLWQTGTVEAVRKLAPDALMATLTAGADAVRAAHADLVLIDPQFSRMLSANTDLGPYIATLAHAATGRDVALFRRYDLTRRWVETGRIDIERADPAQRREMTERLHVCLGQALADLITRGAGGL